MSTVIDMLVDTLIGFLTCGTAVFILLFSLALIIGFSASIFFHIHV
jgi:hypothetical protein